MADVVFFFPHNFISLLHLCDIAIGICPLFSYMKCNFSPFVVQSSMMKMLVKIIEVQFKLQRNLVQSSVINRFRR